MNDVVNVRDYGAFGDGASHPITTALAVGDQIPGTSGSTFLCLHAYPVGTELDAVAAQEAAYRAMGGTTTGSGYSPATRKRPLYLPGGKYLINRTVTLVNTVGFNVCGDGRQISVLFWNGGDADLLSLDACAYGLIADLSFDTSTATTAASALVSYDRTGAVGSFAPQQTTVRDCSFSGGAVGFQLSRSGGAAQGDTIVWHNCTFVGCSEAGLRIGRPDAYATNAVCNQLVGGDFQCPKYGIANYGGQFHAVGTHFEAGSDQIANGGADVCGVNANGFWSTLDGCRSESTILSRGVDVGGGNESVGCVGFFTNCYVLGGNNVSEWSATTAYLAGQLVTGTRASPGGKGDGRLYRVTTAGTTGTTEPTWNGDTVTSTTVTSGGVTFTYVPYNVVHGFVSLRYCGLAYGTVSTDYRQSGEVIGTTFTRADWQIAQQLIQDVTSGARHIEYGNRVSSNGYLYNFARSDIRPKFRLPNSTDLLWQGGSHGTADPDVGFRGNGDGTLDTVGTINS